VQGFGFHTLALLCAVGFAGPLLASVKRFRIPVVIGELVVGCVVGWDEVQPSGKTRMTKPEIRIKSE